MYPQAIIFYVPILALIVVFVAGINSKKLIKGLLHTFITLGIGALSYAYFFTSYLGVFYSFDSGVISAINSNLTLVNVARLWGSTFNYQFETYYPESLILFSFVPIILAFVSLILRHRNKWLYFFALLYIFSLVPELAGDVVFSLPFGFAFRILSLFLIPSALGLATLIGFSSDTIILRLLNLGKNKISKFTINFVSLALLLLIVLSGVPWWIGETSGAVVSAPATKLNLFELPSGYLDWSNFVQNIDTGMFVLYLPITLYLQLENTTYFSEAYQGVNNPLFQPMTVLSPVQGGGPVDNAILSLWDGNTSQIAEVFGSASIKYIVVLTNTTSDGLNGLSSNNYLSGLSEAQGILEVYQLPGVVVFEVENAKPIVYSNSANVSLVITSRNPASYEVVANSVSPFTLVFNQEYNPSWIASVNGNPIPASDHFKFEDFFNGWRVNSTGLVTIELNYEPQRNYFTGVLISILTFYGVSAYLIAVSVKGLVVQRKRR